MSADQPTPDVETVLAEHQARFHYRGLHYRGPQTRTTCAAKDCTWECAGDRGDKHIAHVAAALEPLIREREAKALEDAADALVAEFGVTNRAAGRLRARAATHRRADQ